MKVVFIRGRNRQEARKKTLDYWFANRDQFNCSMRDFLRKCTTDSTGRVVMYKEWEMENGDPSQSRRFSKGWGRFLQPFSFSAPPQWKTNTNWTPSPYFLPAYQRITGQVIVVRKGITDQLSPT